MNPAVSSSFQMNSSAICITFTGISEASSRPAIKKIGTFSSRERTSLTNASALEWVLGLSSPKSQSSRMPWSAASDTITDIPSSADLASTTSISQVASSSISARNARPPAVDWPSSSSTIRVLKWILFARRSIIVSLR